jgi:lysyl-tRNA synthetase class I
MQHRLPDNDVVRDHAVHDDFIHADPWRFICAKCAQIMTIKIATPVQAGVETRTYGCTCGHRETLDVSLR